MSNDPYLLSKKDDRIGIVYTTGKVVVDGQTTGYTITFNDIFQFKKPICVICARDNTLATTGTLFISKDNLNGETEFSTGWTRVFRAIDTTSTSSHLYAYELTFTYPNTTLAFAKTSLISGGGGSGTVTSVDSISPTSGNSSEDWITTELSYSIHNTTGNVAIHNNTKKHILLNQLQKDIHSLYKTW